MPFGHLLGCSFRLERTVRPEMAASAVGSGGVDVLATPTMVLLMEQAARDAVQDRLPGGSTTVGFEVSIRHLAPTPVGSDLTVHAEVTAVEGRKLVYAVRAEDACGRVGEGSHTRFVIDLERFMEGLAERIRGSRKAE